MGLEISRYAKATTKDHPKIKNGVLISYAGTLAQVSIDGVTLSLQMLDSVSATIPVGTTVVCQVHGMTGYVIGSLATTSRSASGTWAGGYSNPPVPSPATLASNYLQVTPFGGANGSGNYNDSTASWAALSSGFQQDPVNSIGSAWFYGSTAFASVASKTLISLEVYLPSLSSGNYPLNFAWHNFATRPSGSPGGFQADRALRYTSGWVTLPTAFVTALGSNLSAFGIGIMGDVGTQQATLSSSASPYGTLRIGWK